MDLLFFKGGQSDRSTMYVVTKTSANPFDQHHEEDEDEDDHQQQQREKKTRPAKRTKTTTRPTTVSPKIVVNRPTVPMSDLIENNPCTFQEHMPDPDNCQGNRIKLIFNRTNLHIESIF